MLVTLDGHGALYQQVYEALRGAILSGRLLPGTRLPSTRALAGDLHVSRNTILLAYDQLYSEGYVEGRQGSGTYVATDLPEDLQSPEPMRPKRAAKSAAARKLSEYGERIAGMNWVARTGASPDRPELKYDFRYGLPDVESFPKEVWRRIVARRARGANPVSCGYSAPEGVPELRTAIAGYLERSRGVVCRPDQVLIVTGSQQALDLTARVMLNPGDTLLMEEPHYVGARMVFLAGGARIVTAPVDSDGIVTDAVTRHANVRLVYTTPSHQFPTGAILSLPRRLALLAWAVQECAYIVEDDYDSEFRYDTRPVPAMQGLDTGDRVIYLGTFSKVLFPGLRVGYMVVPDTLLEAFRRAKWLTDRGTPTLEQEALADFIAEGYFERYLRRARSRNAERRAALLDALAEHFGERVEVVGENAGIHVLVWLRGVPMSRVPSLIERAAKAGVGVYGTATTYLEAPREAALLMGYAALSERQIRAGIRGLAIAWAD